MISRRDAVKIVAAIPVWVAAGAGIDSVVNGVRLGTITYSFRDLPRTAGKDNVDAVIKALQFCGIGEIELFSANIEPAPRPLAPPAPTAYGVPPPTPAERSAAQRALEKENRDDLRRWRIETPAGYFTAIREKFDTAGIAV